MKVKLVFVLAVILVSAALLSGCGLLAGSQDSDVGSSPMTSDGGGAGGFSQEPMLIGGDVFSDSNGNATKDEGEPIIAGVTVQIAQGECPGYAAGQTTTTLDTASYKFEGMTGGAYCISVDPGIVQNARILGQGHWTFPQQVQGTIADTVYLNTMPRATLDFGWTFANLRQATPANEGTPGDPDATPLAAESAPVQFVPTPTPLLEATTHPAACIYKANYLADVTIPDNSTMEPGLPFVKTWRVQNTGTCPWGPGTGLQNMQFISGDPLGAQTLVPLATNIAPGATGNISINMVVPVQNGTLRSNWKLRADDGRLIGVGSLNVPLYALIRVKGAVSQLGPPTDAIQMSPDTVEADVQGHLGANTTASYTVNAEANQNLRLLLSSNTNSVRIAALAPGGVPLSPQHSNSGGTYWEGKLPTTGTYVIQVIAGNAAPIATYTLSVMMPVRIKSTTRMTFASVNGSTSDRRIVTYLLKAKAEHTMSAKLIAPPNSAGLAIYGLDDGQPLIRSESGATSFGGQLPRTQDYVIQVVPFGNLPFKYALDITVQ